ncbi:MAG: YegS/Rv2252/BmrU family lipid kinase [Chloroflexaceae bacterium]|nr:YegS/Rv2252/BmrU family lipid kinase [Chloroflexaceae bacterium]
MTRTACLIYNPKSGQSDRQTTAQELAKIEAILSEKLELEVQKTSEDVGADLLAQQAIQRGVNSLIVAGGDGTVSAVVAAAAGTDIPVGVIARGTANAFAVALGIPTDLEGACQTILDGHTWKIDAARCNGRPMALLAGIGFEAETIEETNRQAKHRWGIFAYIFTAFKKLSDFKPFTVEIITDTQIIRSYSARAVTIANAAPPTSVLAHGPAGIIYDDGLLDVTLVAPKNWINSLLASYHLFFTALQEKAAERPDVGYLRAKKLRVLTDTPQEVVVDGELFGTTPLVAECIPGGLTIFMPLRSLQDRSHVRPARNRLLLRLFPGLGKS